MLCAVIPRLLRAMREPPTHTLLHYWLLFSVLSLVAIYIAWDTALLATIYRTDSTRISIVISVIYLMASCHCARRAWFLSQQQRLCGHGSHPHGISLCQDYLEYCRSNPAAQSESTALAESLGEKLRGSHDAGWFIVGLLVKLGLLGTVVGFVLMLSSVSGLETLDISDIKQLMQRMTQGMGVAMNTTMVGLVSSMLLGIQYLMLDRAANQLLAETIDRGHAPAVTKR